jgi:hypothetical protein
MTIASERFDLDELDFEPESHPAERIRTMVSAITAALAPTGELIRAVQQFRETFTDVFGVDLTEARRISEESAAFLQRNPELWEALCECTPSRGKLLSG